MPRELIIREEDLGVDGEYFSHEEIIRCKDCKYYDSDWWMGDCHLERWGDGWGNYPPPTVTEDGFCSWGERREDGETN